MSSLELGPAGKLSCEKLPVHGLRTIVQTWCANLIRQFCSMLMYIASYVLSKFHGDWKSQWYKNYNSDNQTLSCSLYVVNVLRKNVLDAQLQLVCE